MDTPEGLGELSNMLAFDYYDGPVSGAALSADGQAAYRFQMVDWDLTHDVRIFVLSPLPIGSFKRLVSLFSRYDVPRWPVWALNGSFPTDEAAEGVYSEIDAIPGTAGPPEVIAAWRNRDRCVIAAKKVGELDVGDLACWSFLDVPIAGRDWFETIGLQRAA
jgi:hypothetical protein